MTTAAIYARISLDRHEGEGVARQLDDCRALASERGWDVLEYVDNDISAYRSARRPRWEQLLADLRSGLVDTVVAYHPDRLYRKLADLEELIDALDQASAQVATIRAGDIDLSTATGRMQARIIAAVARHESERTGERVSRAKRQRAAEGRPAGGGRRPFGLTADRSELVPEEADALREAAAGILAGSSYLTQVKRLDDAGITSTAGNPWTVAALRRVLTSPHVAGLRAYHGEIVGQSTSPAILDRDTWDALRLTAQGRKRGRPPADRFLLTGLLQCGGCGHSIWGNTNAQVWVYRCSSVWRRSQTCAVTIGQDALDEYVCATVGEWLADESLAAALAARGAPPVDDASAEVVEIERRRALLSARYAAGEIEDDEYDSARKVFTDRLSRLDDRRSRHLRVIASPDLAALGRAWEHASLQERRAIIEALIVTPMVVTPVGKGSRVPASERVDLVPVWES